MKRTKTKLWLSKDHCHAYCLWHKKPKADEDGDFVWGTLFHPILEELCSRDVHRIFGIKLKNHETIPVELTVTIKKLF